MTLLPDQVIESLPDQVIDDVVSSKANMQMRDISACKEGIRLWYLIR